MRFRLGPKSVNYLERHNNPYFALLISPNSIAFWAHYVKADVDRSTLSATKKM